MTQKEILDREANNTGSIWLYLEGSFYKAYERGVAAENVIAITIAAILAN